MITLTLHNSHDISSIKPTSAQSRWNWFVQRGDAKQIWRSIDWHGSFDTATDELIKPSDSECCLHYENLLNPDQGENQVYIPDQP